MTGQPYNFGGIMQSIVSVKGQTVIPKEVREALGIEPGSKIMWVIKDGEAEVFPVAKDPVRALRGVLKGYGTFAEWLEERNEERARERKKDEKEEEEARRWRSTPSTRQP
jgi:AbrB family looped-hinge helix DNA binding protein